jgi:hypothetical protein
MVNVLGIGENILEAGIKPTIYTRAKHVFRSKQALDRNYSYKSLKNTIIPNKVFVKIPPKYIIQESLNTNLPYFSKKMFSLIRPPC